MIAKLRLAVYSSVCGAAAVVGACATIAAAPAAAVAVAALFQHLHRVRGLTSFRRLVSSLESTWS